jgi:class 3 adenylate cyclase
VAVGEIEYAESGDTHIAYRVIGEAGRVDVVVVAAALFPFEMLAEDRVTARFIAGLAALGRVVVFDKRGVGLSDPITDWSRSVQEQWAEDLISVIEAAGLKHPVVVSWEPFGVARLAACTRPDLFDVMVLLNPSWSTRRYAQMLGASAGKALPSRSVEEVAFPSRINDREFISWLERAGRAGASPTSAARIWGQLLGYEEALTQPGITARTLVIHRRDCMQPEGDVRSVVDDIPGSTFVQVAGVDVYPIAGDIDVLIDEIAEFVTGGPSGLAPLRHVSAVMFTDLVDSTLRAIDEGDAQWRDLLDVHDRTVQRCVRQHGGRVVKYTGDGVLALMPSATGALEAAASIRDQLAPQGLHVRAGIHVGDVDIRGDDVSGLAVNIAARIMGHADADETLVSEAVRQATLGSTHRFDAVRTTKLKGLADDWTLSRHLA